MKYPSIKKAFAYILAIAMILSLMTASVFAADENSPEQTEIVSQVIEDEAVSETPAETEEAVSVSEEADGDVREGTDATEETGGPEGTDATEETGGPEETGDPEETDIPEETVSETEEAVSESEEDGEENPDSGETSDQILSSTSDEYGTVKYLDKDGNERECGIYGLIDSTTSIISVEYSVAFDEVVINHPVTINGNIKLILTDGCKLTINGGISISSGSSLTIYAQSTSKETMGVLNANAYGYIGKAGIEVNSKSSGLTICGGNVTALGAYCAAGIGGSSKEPDSGSITIYGGNVFARGGMEGGLGAGIGGAQQGDSNNITICGGNVIAKGGEKAAGIGGGAQGDSEGTITISGGHVEATGGCFAAGIGGGCYGNANIVKITGGETIALGDQGGAGIGGGEEDPFGVGGEFDEFVFTGGTVKATAIPDGSKCGMAIGGGADGDEATYNVVIGDKYFLMNNETGKPHELGFSRNYSSIFSKKECYVSIVPTSAYPVSYLTHDAYGDTTETECTDYSVLYSEYYITDKPMELAGGWYVMAGTGKYAHGFEIKGDVHLILTDGCSLTVESGIRIGQGAELTVYGQSEGITAGKLIAYGTVGPRTSFDYVIRAGIGSSGSSSKDGSSGKLTIHGGNITAFGSEQAMNRGCAGIGGLVEAPNLKPVELTMYGGILTAKGYYGSPGIGGCHKAPGGIVNIYGGTINAESVRLYIEITGSEIVGPAIGGFMDNADNGTVYVGNNVVLIDNKTGKQITKGPDEKWVDKFSAPSISITATRDMQPVSYQYYDVETGNYERGTCEKYFTSDNAGSKWETGWYVFDGYPTIYDEIVIDGDVHMILKDDCYVTMRRGIHINNGASLSIYSQSFGEDMGYMYVFNVGYTGEDNGKAGIRTTNANLYVHGGSISANGAYWGAGIGGDSNMKNLTSESGGNVTVYGGQLEGIGGDLGAGIGGGGGAGGNGGTLTVIGGTVIAKGTSRAAGIGGGERGAGGTVNLYGGTVKSAGGREEGRAIGCGGRSSGSGTINVKEGFVLIDNDTNKEIKKEDGEAWTDILTGEAVNIRVEKKSEDDPTDDVSYKIIYGSDSAWTKGSKEGAQFVSDAEFAKFKDVKVDGAVVDPSCYTAEEGSTKVTLTAGYMESLKEGEHTLEIVSEDGSASTSFTVNAANRDNPSNPEKPDSPKNPDNPNNPGNVKTGDGSRTGLWLMLLVAAAAALCGTYVYGRKKN